MATSFTGLLAMFGLKLGHKHVEFAKSYQGFYFSNGENGAGTLGAIDCCNYIDWIARCVGIDINGYGPYDKYNYAKDGYTPDEEILAKPGSDYYTKGEGGDYLIRKDGSEEHIAMIVADDGNEYFYADNGNFAEISYATYEELEGIKTNNGSKYHEYKVTNMDALYRNTAIPKESEYVYYGEDGNLAKNSRYAYKESKTEVFAKPEWIINQKNINLTPEEQQSLIRQYNERNKNTKFMSNESSETTNELDIILKESIPNE